MTGKYRIRAWCFCVRSRAATSARPATGAPARVFFFQVMAGSYPVRVRIAGPDQRYGFGVTSALVELRVLEGPNLYFPRAAVKLTLDLSRLAELPSDRA